MTSIPPQDPDTAQRPALCEALSFSPWHGIDDHRPLGGINRRAALLDVAAQHSGQAFESRARETHALRRGWRELIRTG